jgi:hypothetical protein
VYAEVSCLASSCLASFTPAQHQQHQRLGEANTELTDSAINCT